MHAGDVLAEENRLTATGVVNNGLDYEAQVLVVPEAKSMCFAELRHVAKKKKRCLSGR